MLFVYAPAFGFWCRVVIASGTGFVGIFSGEVSFAAVACTFGVDGVCTYAVGGFTCQSGQLGLHAGAAGGNHDLGTVVYSYFRAIIHFVDEPFLGNL